MRRILLFTCLVQAITFSTSAQVLEQDSLALVALYNATAGDNWTDNSGWLNTVVSNWHGIEVDDQRVRRISLGFNNLTGYIPDEIGDLDSATHIYFHGNTISGEIPEAIGNCAALELLDVGANALTGTFPMEMANCTRLRRVTAYQNQFSGPFPEVFLNMPAINRLELGDNNFSGQLPPSLSTLTNLILFTIDRNNFSGPMPSIRNMKELSECHIRGNALEGRIDTILGYLPSMYYFTFSNNNFTGCVSDTFFNPERLTYLHLDNNNFDCMGDFSAFADTGVIQRIWCRNNRIPFEFLEPNTGVGNFQYAPQDSLLEPEMYILEAGDTVEIYSGTGGVSTTYTWYKDGEFVPGEESPYLEIIDFQDSDAGAYYCAATNDSLPELTLYRHQVHLQFEETSAVSAIALVKPLTIYPNPASGIVMFDGLLGQGKLQILDLEGREQLRLTTDLSTPLHVHSLLAGTYVVHVDLDGVLYSGRFIKL